LKIITSTRCAGQASDRRGPRGSRAPRDARDCALSNQVHRAATPLKPSGYLSFHSPPFFRRTSSSGSVVLNPRARAWLTNPGVMPWSRSLTICDNVRSFRPSSFMSAT